MSGTVFPIHPAPAAPEAGIGGIDAVLSEIASLLDRLVAGGEPGAIDLRALPLAPIEHQLLREALGSGEVQAEVQAQGRTLIHETAYHGVWWVVHHDANDAIIAELIEVSLVPELLACRRVEARFAAGRLRASVALRRTPSNPS
jgi:hydrogenase-1 operon protein HyaF